MNWAEWITFVTKQISGINTLTENVKSHSAALSIIEAGEFTKLRHYFDGIPLPVCQDMSIELRLNRTMFIELCCRKADDVQQVNTFILETLRNLNILAGQLRSGYLKSGESESDRNLNLQLVDDDFSTKFKEEEYVVGADEVAEPIVDENLRGLLWKSNSAIVFNRLIQFKIFKKYFLENVPHGQKGPRIEWYQTT